MRPLAATYYDGRTSGRREVEVWIRRDGEVHVLGLGAPRVWPLGGVTVSERVANVPRTLAFPDGSVCELADNDAVADEYLLGTETAAGFQFDDDNETRKIGYIGPKRYCRVTVTPANNTGDAFLAAVWIQSGARKAPQS